MPPGNREAYCVAGLVAAMIGHSFSCFTGFKGGKGVATGAGGFLVLMPQVTLIAAAVWALLFFSIRYVSLASIAAALTIPVGAYFFNEPLVLIAAAAAAAIFVIVRHRANISRLIHGTENRAHPAVGEDS
jgi:glycerol-3-phosphate acyltransferase PlsY